MCIYASVIDNGKTHDYTKGQPGRGVASAGMELRKVGKENLV